MRPDATKVIRRLTTTTINGFSKLNQPIKPESRLWRVGLWVIIIVFTVTTLVQSLSVPVFEGSDEQRHYAYARYLVNHLSLPPREREAEAPEYRTYKVGQEAGQPPLNYIPVALLTAAVPGADDAARYVIWNPLWTLSDDAGLPDASYNYFLHGHENDFPWQGVALAVHLGRLWSVLAGVLTLFGVYGIARELVPSRPAVALFATILFGSVPGILFIFGVISNDVAITLFATLCIWVAVRIARKGATAKLAVLGGLLGGLATLSKVNGLWAMGIVWLALAGASFLHRRAHPLQAGLLMLALSMAVWLLMTGWWFAWGTLQDGDPLGIAIHVATPGQSLLSFFNSNTPFFTTQNLLIWDRTTWYSASWARFIGPDWVYQTFRYLYLAGLVGAVAAGVSSVSRALIQRQDIGVEVIQVVALLLAILFSVAMAIFWQMMSNYRLGRYIYPGLISAAVLAAIGWAWFIMLLRRLRMPQAGGWVLGIVAVLLMQRAAVWTTANTIRELLPHPMIRPVPPDATPTQLTYLDPVDKKTPVAGVSAYRVHYQDLRPGNALYVDLCWKSTGYARQSFPYSMQLVGPNDVRIGSRNAYHGLSTYPMTAWQPGETFCDPTSLAIGQYVDRPRAYNLIVTLFPLDPPDYQPGPALPAVDANGRSIYPVIGRVRAAPASMPVVTPTIRFGDIAGLVDTHFELQPTHGLSITLRWVALSQPSVDYKVFLHVMDKPSGAIIAQSDHEPDSGWFPTNFWLKGDVIDDQFEIPLPANVDPLGISLRLGMYDAQTQARLPSIDPVTQQRYPDDAVPINP